MMNTKHIAECKLRINQDPYDWSSYDNLIKIYFTENKSNETREVIDAKWNALKENYSFGILIEDYFQKSHSYPGSPEIQIFNENLMSIQKIIDLLISRNKFPDRETLKSIEHIWLSATLFYATLEAISMPRDLLFFGPVNNLIDISVTAKLAECIFGEDLMAQTEMASSLRHIHPSFQYWINLLQAHLKFKPQYKTLLIESFLFEAIKIALHKKFRSLIYQNNRFVDRGIYPFVPLFLPEMQENNECEEAQTISIIFLERVRDVFSLKYMATEQFHADLRMFISGLLEVSVIMRMTEPNPKLENRYQEALALIEGTPKIFREQQLSKIISSMSALTRAQAGISDFQENPWAILQLRPI